MLDVEGLQLTAEDRELLGRPQVGGVILGLFGRNFESVGQLQELVAAIRECNPRMLVAVDQEGGRVQRFKKEFTRLPAMHTLGESYLEDEAKGLLQARQCGWLMASEVLSCGLDLSFAPVLDLYSPHSRIIANRAFATEPAVVIAMARAFIEGMHDAGMKATGKHFPGHGTVVADSHVEVPVDTRSLEQLQDSDLQPFAALSGLLDAVMPGHVVYSAVDPHCAALSPLWLQQILRQTLGFQGVIFSDDLSMAAAETAGDIIGRAEAALQAGCDMILVCNNRGDALKTLDWLDRNNFPGNPRLHSMSGNRGISRDKLLASHHWQQASEVAASLAT